ncbi:MAG: hypothetical protein ABL928_03825 [Sphingorhabdus sp.]
MKLIKSLKLSGQPTVWCPYPDYGPDLTLSRGRAKSGLDHIPSEPSP